MPSLNGLVRFLIKQHYLIGPLLVAQYFLGDKIGSIATKTGIARETLRDLHIEAGEIFMYAGLLLVAVKLLMFVGVFPSRRKIDGGLGVFIHWHWVPLIVCLVLQYMTIKQKPVLNSVFGWTKEQCFAVHGYSGMALMIAGIWLLFARYGQQFHDNQLAIDAAAKAKADGSAASN